MQLPTTTQFSHPSFFVHCSAREVALHSAMYPAFLPAKSHCVFEFETRTGRILHSTCSMAPVREAAVRVLAVQAYTYGMLTMATRARRDYDPDTADLIMETLRKFLLASNLPLSLMEPGPKRPRTPSASARARRSSAQVGAWISIAQRDAFDAHARARGISRTRALHDALTRALPDLSAAVARLDDPRALFPHRSRALAGVTVTTYLSPEASALLDEICEATGRSRSDIVRRCLAWALKNPEPAASQALNTPPATELATSPLPPAPEGSPLDGFMDILHDTLET